MSIIKYLKKYGDVLTEHVGNVDLLESGELTLNDIYQRDLQWLQKSEVIIAEVSNPSLGVGYEIAKAEEMKKRIVCLYNKKSDKKLSAMIKGNKNIVVVEYDNLKQVFECVDNFFGNPKQDAIWRR